MTIIKSNHHGSEGIIRLVNSNNVPIFLKVFICFVCLIGFLMPVIFFSFFFHEIRISFILTILAFWGTAAYLFRFFFLMTAKETIYCDGKVLIYELEFFRIKVKSKRFKISQTLIESFSTSNDKGGRVHFRLKGFKSDNNLESKLTISREEFNILAEIIN